MTIANPLAWGLLLLAVPIILLFFLKVRFRKEFVATMIFWYQVFEERRTRKLYPRFRSFLSLFLALLFLTFLTASVLDPAFFAAQNNRCVLIIDNSARMNALLPDGTTRLDDAKRQARKRIDQLTAGQHVAVLTANVNPSIISGFTGHAGTLRRKISEIPATDFPGNLPAAWHLAGQLIADTPDAPIEIYTHGEPLDNVAITRFQPRRLPEQAADYEIFIEVVNFGDAAVQTQLEIDCDGKLVDVLPLALEPNQPVTKIVRNTSTGGGLFRAKLADTDLFPTDDVAVAFLSEQFVQRILLYGHENFFLWHVLQSQPQVEVVLVQEIPDTIPPDNVLVLHQTVPPTLPPGNVMVIDPQNDCDIFRVGEHLERPMAAKVDERNPLVQFIPPGLLLPGARNITSQTAAAKALLETAEGFPLYQQWLSDERRMLVFSADLNQGDFSLRTAFPILMSQALSFFRNSEEMQRAFSTAEPVKLTLQTEKTQVILRSPSGREEVFPCQDGSVSLGRLNECGVWTIIEPETGRELAKTACNLFNAAESNFHSANDVPLIKESAMERNIPAGPIWHLLALFALLLTATEWFLYQRRWIE